MFCLVFDVLFVRYSRRSRYTCVLESEPEKKLSLTNILAVYIESPISLHRAALPYRSVTNDRMHSIFFSGTDYIPYSKYLPSLFQDSFSVALSKVPILFHRYHRLSIESKRRDTFVDFKKMFRTTQHRF